MGLNPDDRDSARRSNGQSVFLPGCFARAPATGTDEAVGGVVDADGEAPVAAPPALEQGTVRAALPPLQVAAVAAPQEILLVVDAEVVAEVILAEEGRPVAVALAVVALELFLLVVVDVLHLVVPVQVGGPAERLLLASGDEARVPLLLCGGSCNHTSVSAVGDRMHGWGGCGTYSAGWGLALWGSSGPAMTSG